MAPPVRLKAVKVVVCGVLSYLSLVSECCEPRLLIFGSFLDASALIFLADLMGGICS